MEYSYYELLEILSLTDLEGQGLLYIFNLFFHILLVLLVQLTHCICPFDLLLN